MSGALRSIFAELGFDVDFAALEKLDADLKALASAMDAEAKKADALAKSTAAAAKHAADAAKKAAEEAAAAKKHAADVARTGTKEEAAAARKVADEKAEAAKKAAEASKAAADAAKQAGDAAKIAGKAAEDANKKATASAEEHAEAQKDARDAMVATSAAAVALGAHMALAFGREFAAAAEALRDTAIESRVTTSELQGLDHAAVQAGVGVERMRAGVAQFGQALRQGERWGNGTTSTLRRLGITTRDAAGHIRPTADLLDELAVGMERIESPYRRARVAQHLFGESGRRMLEVMHTGPGGIRALREELEELGGGVTPEAVEASRRFTQAQERQSRAMDSLRSVLATSLLPVLSWFMNLVAKAEGALAKLTRGTHVVEVGLALLGAAAVRAGAMMVAAWLPAAAPFLVAAAAALGLVLVLDDLITFVEGGDSALGRMIDSLFGVGSAAATIDFVRSSWAGVKEILDEVEQVLNTVSQKFQEAREFAAPVLSAINRYGGSLLGADVIGGAQVGAAAAPGPVDDGGFMGGVERAARGRRAAATGVRGVSVAAPQVVTAPGAGTMVVAAPGAAGARTVTRTISRTSAPQLHFHGITEAGPIVARVREELRREEAAQRDADHPTEDDD